MTRKVRSSEGAGTARFTRTGRRSVLALAVLVLNTVLWVGASVAATPGAPPEPEMRLHVTDTGMTMQDGPSEIRLTELVPGTSEHLTVLVTNGTNAEVRLELGVSELVGYENGCTPPEREVDRSCASGDGELGAALRLSTGAEGTSGAARSVPVRQAVDRHLSLPPIAPGASSRIGVTLAVPGEVDNRIQSDRALFDLVWLASGPVTRADVAVPVSSESGGSPDFSLLARTGVPIRTLLGVGLLTLGAGALAVRFGRVRKMRRHE